MDSAFAVRANRPTRPAGALQDSRAASRGTLSGCGCRLPGTGRGDRRRTSRLAEGRSGLVQAGTGRIENGDAEARAALAVAARARPRRDVYCFATNRVSTPSISADS